MKIALLGAPSTGKTRLAEALGTHFSNSGWAVYRVEDCLREWCGTHQRSPKPHELTDVAHKQMAHVLQAPEHAMVVADTTPIMMAVDSQLNGHDHSLDAQAIAWQHQFDITLLTGLDIPCATDMQREDSHTRESVDSSVRQMLDLAKVNYQVVYGLGEQRLDNALFCIAAVAAKLSNPMAQRLCQSLARPEITAKWTGACETCGDGECEHRLFTRLVKQ